MYVNNLRYGEISRRNAGRFDTEYYMNGAFSFRNMITNIEGGAARRPPIRKLLDADIKRLVPFTISEDLSYVIGLDNDRMHFYRFVLGEFSEVVSVEYPKSVQSSGTPLSMTLTDEEIAELTYTQYYTRMYFAHQDWRPFMVDYDAASDTATVSSVTIVLNQDAKEKYWFTPSYIADEKGEIPSLEGRVLYSRVENGITVWYLDEDFKEQYEYSATYPPVHGESSYISNFDEFEDDDLLTGDGNYPAIISVISDSLWMASTRNHPATIWKSRILGTSQWIEGYVADSMHDFVQFQAVWSETQEMVDEEDLPMKPLTSSSGDPVYEQSSAEDIWYKPDRDADGNYTYQQRLYRKINVENDDEWTFYIDPEMKNPYTWSDEEDAPVRKPIMIYDFSDMSRIMRTKVAIDYVATDSTSTKNELATGRQDRIRYIKPACGYIMIGTSTEEWRLPYNFSAVSNQRAEPYKSFGCIAIQPAILNNSLLFVQKSGVLREFYLYEGYMTEGDVTILNHEILKIGVQEMVTKNTPSPTIYFIMSDGTLRALVYDKANGIQSFSRWDMEGRKIIGGATIETGMKDMMLFLVTSDTESFIAMLDEDEEEDFSDEGDIDYLSEIVTPYTEIIDNRNGFGHFKKANQAYIRPYNTGFVYMGDDLRQMNKTPHRLGSDDYRYVLMGKSDRMYSMRIQSFENDPMTVLAFQFEV